MSTEQHLFRYRSQLSLSSQFEESPTDFVGKRNSRVSKTSLDDFELVRGLGKGAFGKVFMIKEREVPISVQSNKNILSISHE